MIYMYQLVFIIIFHRFPSKWKGNVIIIVARCTCADIRNTQLSRAHSSRIHHCTRTREKPSEKYLPSRGRTPVHLFTGTLRLQTYTVYILGYNHCCDLLTAIHYDLPDTAYWYCTSRTHAEWQVIIRYNLPNLPAHLPIPVRHFDANRRASFAVWTPAATAAAAAMEAFRLRFFVKVLTVSACCYNTLL